MKNKNEVVNTGIRVNLQLTIFESNEELDGEMYFTYEEAMKLQTDKKRLPTREEMKILGDSMVFEVGEWRIYDCLDKSKYTVMPMNGYRYLSDGSLLNVGSEGICWSSVPSGSNAYILLFYDCGKIFPSTNGPQASGFSVRCIKS